MDKLPYFKFTALKWLNEDISLEDYEAKGVFADVCAFYWLKDCSMTMAMLQRKFSSAVVVLSLLQKNNILKQEEGSDIVRIKFLDEQFAELKSIYEKKQIAGSKGGKMRAFNAKQARSITTAGLQQDYSKTTYIEDNIERDLIDTSLKKKEKEIYKEKEKFFEKVAADYRAYCSKMPGLIKLTTARKQSINARIKDFGIDSVEKVLKLAGSSLFLNGENDRGWVASFDWIFSPSNYAKILEGHYQGNTTTPASKQEKADLSNPSVKLPVIGNYGKK